MPRPLIIQSISRRVPSSVALLLAGVLAVGGTALAPLWERSIEQQTLRTELAAATDDQTRLTVQATTDATRAVFRDSVLDRLTGIATNPDLDAHFGPATGFVVTDGRLGVTGPTGSTLSTRLGYLADGCTKLGIAPGSCPVEQGEAAMSAADAAAVGVRVGDRLVVRRSDNAPTAAVRITAVWSAGADDTDFGADVTDPVLPDGVGTVHLARRPLLVDASTLEKTYADYNQIARVVRHLRPATVGLDAMDSVRAGVAAAEQSALYASSSDFVDCDVERILTRVDSERRTSAVTIGLAAVQLLAITWVGLGVLVRAISTARAPEFAVGSLRGLSGWQVARSAVGATVVLLTAAVPLGWLAAVGVGRVVAPALVGSGAGIEPLRWPVAAAVLVAFAGSVGTAVVAARRAVRTPVASLLHRSAATDGDTRVGVAVEVTVVAVAVVAAVQLVRGGRLEGSGQSGVGLLAPALIAVGAGVVLARLTTLVLRRSSRRVPRGVAALLAGRRLAFAPGVLRGAVVLVAGAAVAASAADLAGIAARNRELRAGQEVGAAVVLMVRADPGVDLRTAVDAADPSGRDAMAAVQRTDVETGVDLIAVDTDRYAAVASVDPRWTNIPATDLASRLHPPVAPVFPITGTRLTVALADVRVVASDPLNVDDGTQQVLPDDAGILVETDLVATVDDGRAWQEVDLGGLDARAQSLTADLPASCATGCRLIGLRLNATAPKAAFIAQLTVTGIGTDRSPVAASAADFTRDGRWIAPALTGSDIYNVSNSQVAPQADGLHVTMTDPIGDPGEGPQVLVADRPAQLPVVTGVGFGQFPLSLAAPGLLGTGLDGADVVYQVQGQSAALPRVGASGALVDLQVALAASDPAERGAVVDQVWVARPSTVPALTRGLAARGVTVVGTQTAAARERELAALGPARATVVAVVAASASLVLALLVALAGLLAAGRNRLYELASLRAAGLRDRTLRRGLVLELGSLLASAVVVGLAVGLGVAGLTTAGLSFYADGGGPPLDLTPDLSGVGTLALVAVAAVVATAVATAIVLVRVARPVRLRESIR